MVWNPSKVNQRSVSNQGARAQEREVIQIAQGTGKRVQESSIHNQGKNYSTRLVIYLKDKNHIIETRQIQTINTIALCFQPSPCSACWCRGQHLQSRRKISACQCFLHLWSNAYRWVVEEYCRILWIFSGLS